MKKIIIYLMFLLFIKNILLPQNNIHLNHSLLLKGKIQIFEINLNTTDNGKEKKNYTGVILINAPMQKVWKVLLEWEKMPDGIKNLKYYKKVYEENSNDGSKEQCIIKNIYIGELQILKNYVDYTLEVSFNHSEYKQYWRMLNTDEVKYLKQKGINASYPGKELRSIAGKQYLESYNNGSQTLFYYSPSVELSFKIPRSIEKIILMGTLKDFLKYVKKKSEII